MADAYYLTGDERSLEMLRKVSDSVAMIAGGEGHEKIRTIFAGAERQLGWPLAVLCRAYKVTGEERYLDAATKIVDYVKFYAVDPLEAYREGKWWRSWMMDGCKVFMSGQLHQGLSAYYSITQDEGMRQAIVRGLDWLIEHMWNPDMNGFVYEFNAMNRGHRRSGMTGLNMQAVDAFRFGYEMTGDERYLSVAVRAFQGRVAEMAEEADGKQFSIETRTSPHTAAYLHRHHILPDQLPPAPKPIRQEEGPVPKTDRPEVFLKAKFEDDLVCETPEGMKTGKAVGTIGYVEGIRGKAVSVGDGGYVVLPAPPEMLQGPGTLALWTRLHFKKQPMVPGQRALFHVEGATPLIDSLAACTIYGELRVRMKDHVGHLNGTAEGSIEHWEPGEWHHVAITWDEKRVRLYLDGEEQVREDEGEIPGDGVSMFPAGGQTRINLGWRFGNWYCDYAIDDLIVCGKALSAEDAQRIARRDTDRGD
jgi:hypothetical protein